MEKNDFTLHILYLNVALLAICYQLQKPIEPYLIEKLSDGATKTEAIQEYARLQSFFSVVQVLGSLVAGCTLDHISPKLGFLISFSASAVSYVLVLNATTTTMLFVSKIPSIFQAGYLCAQTYVAQKVGDSVDRVRILGRIAMCYTLGVIIGPALGGWLSSNGDLYAGARVAFVLSLAALALSAYLPGNAPAQATSSASLTGDGSSSNLILSSESKNVSVSDMSPSSSPGSPALSVVVQAASKVWSVARVVWLLLVVKVLISFANSVSDATRPIVLKDEYSFRHTDLGYFMSVSSCVSALSDGALTGPLVVALGSELSRVQTACISLLIGLYLAQAVLTSAIFGTLWLTLSYYSTLISYMGTNLVILIFRHILSTTVTGQTTGRVSADEKGTLLGLENALYAAARVFGPLVGVQLYSTGRASLVALGSAAVFGACQLLWSRFKTTFSSSVTISSIPVKELEFEEEEGFESKL